jgi:CheY-like chemotaxis protein
MLYPNTIVVVDDDEMIEEMIQAIIESHGCETTSFTNPQEALEFLTRNPDRAILLITDFRMPLLPGPELIRRARLLSPGLHIIAVSGRQDEFPLDDIKESIDLILPKPFLKSEMLNAVNSVLTRVGARCPTGP